MKHASKLERNYVQRVELPIDPLNCEYEVPAFQVRPNCSTTLMRPLVLLMSRNAEV